MTTRWHVEPQVEQHKVEPHCGINMTTLLCLLIGVVCMAVLRLILHCRVKIKTNNCLIIIILSYHWQDASLHVSRVFHFETISTFQVNH